MHLYTVYTVYMCHIFSHATCVHVLSQFLLRPTACLTCFLLFSAITTSPGCLAALGCPGELGDVHMGSDSD